MPAVRHAFLRCLAVSIVAVAALAGLAATASGAQGANISGTWSCCGAGGAGGQTFNISQSGSGSLSGSATYPNGGSTFASISGSVSGSSVSITTTYTGGGYVATFTGTVSSDGSTMSGSWSSNAGQTGTWTATLTSPPVTTPTSPPADAPAPFEYPLAAPSSSFHLFHSEPSLLDGQHGLGVDTKGACQLSLKEVAIPIAGASVARAKRPLGLIKSVKLDVADAGYHVIPLTLTKKGLRLQKKSKKARLAAVAKRDPVHITCTPLKYAGAPKSNPPTPTTAGYVPPPKSNPDPAAGNPVSPPATGPSGSAKGGAVAGSAGPGTTTTVAVPPPPTQPINATFSETISTPNGPASVTLDITGSTITSLVASVPGGCSDGNSGAATTANGSPIVTYAVGTEPVAPNGNISFTDAYEPNDVINGQVTATGGSISLYIQSYYTEDQVPYIGYCAAKADFAKLTRS